MNQVIGEFIRKAVALLCGFALKFLIDAGLLQQADLDQIITAAILLVVAVATFTWRRWLWPFLRARLGA